MSIWIWALLVALIGSAFFAGSETAVVAAGRLRQRSGSQRGERLAGLAERLYHRMDRTLAVVLIGNNLVLVLASISALMITEATAGRLGFELSAFWSDLISTLWVSVLVLITGEILPKSIGHHYALRLSRLGAPLLVVMGMALAPLHHLLEWVVRLLRAPFGGSSRDDGDAVSWETVRLHMEAARAGGALEAEKEAVIRRIGFLSNLSVESMMVPLDRLCLHGVESSVSDLRGKLLETVELRAFLVEERRIVGLIPARRLLGVSDDVELRRLMTPVLRVSRQAPLLDFIEELQPRGGKFAVVKGAGGESLGVIFLEDVLRQLLPYRLPSDDSRDVHS